LVRNGEFDVLGKKKNISDKNKIDELVEYFGLKKDIKKQYKAYSLGMKQKMRIIQALMDEPKYLILDEPFDALDQDSKNSLKNYLNKYLSENINRQLIFTSHEEEDDSFAQEIVFINNKKIIVK
jgi:ABC-2 type transport system ATP-binding protein